MVPVMLGGYLGASVEVGGANARNAASRLWSAEIHLRFPVAHDPVMIHKFHLPFHAITGHKLGAGHLRMAPEGLFKACPPAACTIARPDLPARLGTPVDLRSTSIRGRGFAAYLSACGGQPFNVRGAHYARVASLSTFGFVTIVPRYFAAAK